jgi:Tfp pilus assembly protein PilO
VSRTFRILIVVVITAVVGGGYYKFALAPKRVEAKELADKIAVAQAQLSQTQGLIATYEGARDAYKTNYATVIRLGKAVPTDDDTRSLLVQLDTSAKRSGVGFDTIDVSGSSDASATGTPGAVNVGAFSAQPFSLSFSGTFGTLGGFLSRLDHFVTLNGETIDVRGRLMHVESIALGPGGGGWPALTAQIKASAYIVPETAAVAPSTAAAATTTTQTASATTSTTTAQGSAQSATGTDR